MTRKPPEWDPKDMRSERAINYEVPTDLHFALRWWAYKKDLSLGGMLNPVVREWCEFQKRLDPENAPPERPWE